MSLVTYDFSDSEEESVEETEPAPEVQTIPKKNNSRTINTKVSDNDTLDETNSESNNDLNLMTSMFSVLPKPKNDIDEQMDEEDDIPPVKKIVTESKPIKEKAPVQIKVPSLSEFKDVEEEIKEKRTIQPAVNKSSLFSMLPPPKSQMFTKVSKPLIPQVLSRKPPAPKPQPTKKPTINKTTSQTTKTSSLIGANYDSDSDDESGSKVTAKSSTKLDFFSLSSSDDQISNNELEKIEKETEEMTAKFLSQRSGLAKQSETAGNVGPSIQMDVDQPGSSSTTTFGLPKEEIILKNNVDVGPKLPVPEQDYNVDSQGNVAFDEKAMQYLCGRRGAKRKNEELESANIIEISGDEIKPDEREWLVKALTEEPIHRPVSLGSGPGGQSKRKHQITYLAHQAKAMELELQNQWSQNRMSRKQTQSKYGF